jgi:hypothetical protein
MRAAMLLPLAALAGCHFALPSVFDAAAPGGGAVDLAADPPDLLRIPDGAMPRGIGFPCGAAGDCDSGACVDGYCCDSLCNPADPANLCKACNVPGSEGHCVAAQAGTDPHDQCDSDAVGTCGHDGLCDGKGGCERFAAGTVCGSATCGGSTITYAPACDGNGNCVSPPSSSCAPYTCGSPTACATSCTPPANGCAAPAVCNNGSCGKRALGQPCSSPSDCSSGFCAPQGVCCNSACIGSCMSCNLPGKLGQCSPLAPGTQCAPAGCAGDAKVSARICDGAGACQPAVTTDCTPYTCNTGTAQCYARPCANSTQCAAGHTCNNGSNKCQ